MPSWDTKVRGGYGSVARAALRYFIEGEHPNGDPWQQDCSIQPGLHVRARSSPRLKRADAECAPER
jgi:hypothetical protein